MITFPVFLHFWVGNCFFSWVIFHESFFPCYQLSMQLIFITYFMYLSSSPPRRKCSPCLLSSVWTWCYLDLFHVTLRAGLGSFSTLVLLSLDLYSFFSDLFQFSTSFTDTLREEYVGDKFLKPAISEKGFISPYSWLALFCASQTQLRTIALRALKAWLQCFLVSIVVQEKSDTGWLWFLCGWCIVSFSSMEVL